MSTKIEWTEETWNPIIGCSKVSPGCENCYAEKMAFRLANIEFADDQREMNYCKVVNTSRKWTGTTHFVESALEKPLKRKNPTKYFVCSMSDLFHESVPFEWIDKVMAVIASCPQHTFQILTKRPERMKQWFEHKDTTYKNEGMQGSERIRYLAWHNHGAKIEYDNGSYWPLKNVWLGTTVESQKYIQRIEYLSKCPAIVRFVSVEPMLSRIDFTNYLDSDSDTVDYLKGMMTIRSGKIHKTFNKIDWVICGGESGHKARPMHPDWVRNLRDQCKEANVPFYFKQWGEWKEVEMTTYERIYDNYIQLTNDGVSCNKYIERINNNPVNMKKVGKHKAGCLLDGVEYKQFPKI